MYKYSVLIDFHAGTDIDKIGGDSEWRKQIDMTSQR